MRREKSKCLLEFYGILSMTIENICKQIIPAAKFAIWLAIANFCKLLEMNRPLASHHVHIQFLSSNHPDYS